MLGKPQERPETYFDILAHVWFGNVMIHFNITGVLHNLILYAYMMYILLCNYNYKSKIIILYYSN